MAELPNTMFIPDGPAIDPKTVDLKTIDPFYAGDLETINENERIERERVERERNRANQLYALNVQQLNASGNSGGDYGIAAAERAAALARENAAHDDVNFRENMRERLASRGALDSGQFGWENKEADWDLSMMNKQIESDLQGRRDAAAAARAESQARIASQLQELTLRHQWSDEDYAFELGPDGIKRAAAGYRGTAALSAYERAQQNGTFLPKGETAVLQPDGTYLTKSGKRFNANGDRIPDPTTPAPQEQAAPEPGPQQGWADEPRYNPTPGGGSYAV